MMKMLGSLLFWGFMLVSSVLLFPFAVLIWAVTVRFDKRRFLLHRFTSLWASLYTWLNPVWRVRVVGRENLYEGGPTVLVANHRSLVDILVLFRLQSHFRWVSKHENFRIPFVGWNMTLCDYIPIERGKAGSIQMMMRHCDRALADGNSILMFPEGTRSSTGRLRSFKPGAFHIAERNKVPIQPIIVRGTAEALPKRGFILQGRNDISIEILPVIPAAEVAACAAEEMLERVRAVVSDALKNEQPSM
ncbi:MAG TPA: 1-acyl-sn-glycerol-3-phosphate acyltransferase [Myxococcales bacterium]|nr:1-acyl-sn-glycerol-3-phosphate acyltransferase [Myxococcales bacterium]HIK84899.1 1-acyl-sn-glycerol-3-phosphate acyltransferase [Myxococcales bacterium]